MKNICLEYMRKGMYAMAMAFLVFLLIINQAHAQSHEKRRILVVYGGWEGHQPAECAGIFIQWLKSLGHEVTVSESLEAYTDKSLMNALDLIIQVWTMGQLTAEKEKGLLDAVKNGTGLAGWHGGLGDSFRQNTEYQFMVGGQWVAHPGGIIDYEVNIFDKTDPVTAGITDFKMHSEQYYMHVDPNIKVLATTTFGATYAPWIKGSVIPVVWKKYYGKGRVFYSSLGHQASDFTVPQALEIMKRGILWALESKYAPADNWVQPVYGKRILP